MTGQSGRIVLIHRGEKTAFSNPRLWPGCGMDILVNVDNVRYVGIRGMWYGWTPVINNTNRRHISYL